MSVVESGFFAKNDVRRMALLKGAKRPQIVVANNNNALQFFEINQPSE